MNGTELSGTDLSGTGLNTIVLSGDATLDWILGLAAILVLGLFFFIVRRVNQRRLEGGTLRQRPTKPAESPVFQGAPVAGEQRPISRPGATDGGEPVLAPPGDGPVDVVVRPFPEQAEKSIKAIGPRSEVLPHTFAEIQKSEPKPLFSALSNTRSSFFGRLKNIFGGATVLGPGELEELEEILYTSDLGPRTVQRLMDAIQSKVKSNGASGFETVRLVLKDEMLEIFDDVALSAPEAGAQERAVLHSDSHADSHADSVRKNEDETITHVHHGSEAYIEGLERLDIWRHKPAVVMVVGVNGAGKTTTIGKLAGRIAKSGRRVLVAAGDTFRAAAGHQLRVWTERAQVEIFDPTTVSDPSAIAFMACQKAQSEGFDLVLVDTAGRLHTQKNLMEELKKMRRVITKQISSAPHEVLLILDANSGQNALIQAREFHQALDVTGVVLTKLDGTAKGGVAVGLAGELRLPIKLIGVGEGIDDLRRFSPREFVDSIL